MQEQQTFKKKYKNKDNERICPISKEKLPVLIVPTNFLHEAKLQVIFILFNLNNC